TEIQGLCALALARKTNYKDDRPVKALGKVLLENSNLTSSEQREALDTLGIIASDPAVTILMDLYYTDPSSTPDIFRNIRRSKNVIAKEFLRELFSKGHQTEDIIFTLGEFKDELVLDQMRILAKNERNHRIRAAAIVSWAKISGERVLPELKDTLNGMIRTDGGPIPQAYIDAIISIETDETKDFLNEIMRKYPNTWLSRVIKGRLEGPQF
ncbi:MAG: hypothetical protein MUF38_16440, partial [Anaerolineae bacterium]|nr:hypothetical protein [Anaerolineae bacterium]